MIKWFHNGPQSGFSIRHLIFLSPQMFVRFCILVPPAIWSSQLWGDQRSGPALWSPQNPLVPLPWHPRQLIYRTGLTTSLCSMSLHQQHKLQQEKKVDELGSKSLFLAAEVSSPIYSTFHACSRRKHHYLQHQPGHLFTSFLQKYTSALACLFHGSQCSPCGVQLQQQAILLTWLRKWRN